MLGGTAQVHRGALVMGEALEFGVEVEEVQDKTLALLYQMLLEIQAMAVGVAIQALVLAHHYLVEMAEQLMEMEPHPEGVAVQAHKTLVVVMAGLVVLLSLLGKG
jgi:hypothetical protein